MYVNEFSSTVESCLSCNQAFSFLPKKEVDRLRNNREEKLDMPRTKKGRMVNPTIRPRLPGLLLGFCLKSCTWSALVMV
jgi:hypothetical protein